jgi:hypothetical protein
MDWAYGRWKYDCRNLGLLEYEDIVLDLAALQIASLDHPRHSSSGLIDMLTGMAVELARIVTQSIRQPGRRSHWKAFSCGAVSGGRSARISAAPIFFES